MNLRIALRNIKKNKATSAIHILGLAVAICAAIVIFLIVRFDFNFDKRETQRDQNYRVYTRLGEVGSIEGIHLLAPQAIQRKVTGAKEVAHLKDARRNKAVIQWGRAVFADQYYFSLFPYKWLAGSHEVLPKLG